MNYARTAVLLAALGGLFLAAGYALGGQTGMIIALAVALGLNVFSWWNADKLVLRLQNAHPVDAASAPELVEMVGILARHAGLPMPAVYLVEADQPNAFATGRNPQHGAVAVTTGLIALLSYEELAEVVAHELAHIKNRDTLTMTLAATLAGALGMLANFALFFGRGRDNPLGLLGTLALMILAPIAAMLVQMAISRNREYAADRIGAQICGRPAWLADALEKMQRVAARTPNPRAEQNPATAHLFIINPLTGRGLDSLFSTHPDIASRIARLRAMAASKNPAQ